MSDQFPIYITYAFLGVIVIVLLLYLFAALKRYRANSIIKKALSQENPLDALSQTKLSPLCDLYRGEIQIHTSGGMKSNIPASAIINEANVYSVYNLVHLRLDTSAGTLVGLGLLGTFLGLTIGIKGFNSEDTQHIQESIQRLLNGMDTAFLTSLAGMLASLVFTACDKSWKNYLCKNLHLLTERLDKMYYIDDVQLAKLQQKEIKDELYQDLKGIVETQINYLSKELSTRLSYSNEEGKEVAVANAVREILKENVEQSRALKSFSTDLAIELNNGFDEVLSRQMQQRIIPLMENVDKTTNAIVEHIDQMAEVVASPAADMIQGVVDELKNSMSAMIRELSSGLSGSVTQELEQLVHQLAAFAQSMADFPKNMERISATLQVTIEEVKASISEISNTSANANSTAMQKMQEQITMATGAISNAIMEVKEVMSGITQSSQEQNNAIVSRLTDTADKMGTFLNDTVVSMSEAVKASISHITDDVVGKQSDLIALQEDAALKNKQLMQEQISVLNGTVSSLSASVQQSMKSISDDIANKQVDLMVLQENNAIENKKLMQDQLTFATGTMNEMLGEVKKVMGVITENSKFQNTNMVNHLMETTEKMNQLLSGTVSSLTDSVQQSMSSITTDISEKQANLLTLQNDVLSQTRQLLDSFGVGLTRLERMNEYIMGTMDQFQKAQGEITGSTAHLQTITGDMKLATQLFNKSQGDYSLKMEELQRNSQRGIDEVVGLLQKSGDLSEDYVQKFETIRAGLGSVFQQLQAGLTEYSRTVQTSTQKYLDMYATNLTATTDALSNSILMQNEVVNELLESLNERKTR